MRELRIKSRRVIKNTFLVSSIQLIFNQIKFNNMKNIPLALVALFLFVGITGCKKASEIPATCTNLVKDSDETEIDCGGSCTACASAATLTCTLDGTAYNGISASTYGQILGTSIRLFSNDVNSQSMKIVFVPGILNQTTFISDADFLYAGESYTMDPANPGTIQITAQDTLRKMISGNFAFDARRITNPTIKSANNGVFTNVRYH